jgi:hypothetical protein
LQKQSKKSRFLNRSSGVPGACRKYSPTLGHNVKSLEGRIPDAQNSAAQRQCKGA